MKEYALVGKFIGIWSMEKSLPDLIAAKRKSRSHFDLQLGSKGFFTIIFSLLEDRDRILEGDPYFFNSTRLYLRSWIEIFNPDKEDFTWAPVWIRLYSPPPPKITRMKKPSWISVILWAIFLR
jgi:hypothetical protein